MMDEDQLFELEYHEEMEMLEELENGKANCYWLGLLLTLKTKSHEKQEKPS